MAAMSMAKFSPEMAGSVFARDKADTSRRSSALMARKARFAKPAPAVELMPARWRSWRRSPFRTYCVRGLQRMSPLLWGACGCLVTAQTMYSATYPARGFARDLAMLGPFPGQAGVASANHASLIDSKLANATCTAGAWCEKSGYRFAFAPVCKIAPCKEFVAVATPVSTSTGSRNFCATSDGVIRFSVGPPLTSTISAAKCNSWAPLH